MVVVVLSRVMAAGRAPHGPPDERSSRTARPPTRRRSIITDQPQGGNGLAFDAAAGSCTPPRPGRCRGQPARCHGARTLPPTRHGEGSAPYHHVHARRRRRRRARRRAERGGLGWWPVPRRAVPSMATARRGKRRGGDGPAGGGCWAASNAPMARSKASRVDAGQHAAHGRLPWWPPDAGPRVTALLGRQHSGRRRPMGDPGTGKGYNGRHGGPDWSWTSTPHDRWGPCLLPIHPADSPDHYQPDKPAPCRGPAGRGSVRGGRGRRRGRAGWPGCGRPPGAWRRWPRGGWRPSWRSG
jgi:hypothetical protein